MKEIYGPPVALEVYEAWIEVEATKKRIERMTAVSRDFISSRKPETCAEVKLRLDPSCYTLGSMVGGRFSCTEENKSNVPKENK